MGGQGVLQYVGTASGFPVKKTFLSVTNAEKLAYKFCIFHMQRKRKKKRSGWLVVKGNDEVAESLI